jgi:hypothetical protein
MPEYLALLHHHEIANDSGEDGPPPDAADMADAFARMEQAGIARVH